MGYLYRHVLGTLQPKIVPQQLTHFTQAWQGDNIRRLLLLEVKGDVERLCWLILPANAIVSTHFLIWRRLELHASCPYALCFCHKPWLVEGRGCQMAC